MIKGIRGRLLLAFFSISAFAALTTMAAVYSFLKVGDVLEHITERRMPSALTSLELSMQVEHIVAAAPTLLGVTDEEQHLALAESIEIDLEQLRTSLDRLKDNDLDPVRANAIEDAVLLLGTNLLSLDNVVSSILVADERKEQRLTELAGAIIAFRRFLTPQIRVMDAKALRLRRLLEDDPSSPSIAQLAGEITPRLPMEKMLLEVSAINDTLLQAAAEEQPANLTVLEFPLQRSLDRLESTLAELPEDIASELATLVNNLEPFVNGPFGIPPLRAKQLEIVADGQYLLSVNNTLSGELTSVMQELVDAARADIVAANRDALDVQRVSTNFLIGVVLLMLVSSIVIVSLYVDRNLLRRLRSLSESMLSIASGNLTTPVTAGGRDEIGAMAAALEVFRNTALEVERSNLREIDAARRQLTDAIESVSEGFALFDQNDRLVLSNSRYRKMLDLDSELSATYTELLDGMIDAGLVTSTGDDVAGWRDRQLEQHRNPGGTSVLQLNDGRWIRVIERRTGDGNTVGVYSDITELKQREIELAEAMLLQDRTLAELTIVLDTIEYGVLLLDADLRIRVANRKYREIWQMPEDFFTDRPSLQADGEYCFEHGLYPTDYDWQPAIEEIRAGSIEPREWALADGTVVQFQCVALPDGGRMLAYFDITDLKRRESELAAAVAGKDSVVGELQAVLDNIDYGIVFADADLRVRLTNQAFREMWEIPEEITRRAPGIRELIDFHRGRGVHHVDDADWDRYVQQRVDAIAAGHIRRREISTRDGRTFLYQCVALPAGVRMLTYFEITPLKRVEEALRESEERYSLALHGANEGLWEWKADTAEVYISPRFREIAALPAKKLTMTMKEWDKIVHPDDYRVHHEALIAHLRGEREFYDAEFRVLSPDGDYHWVQARGIGLRDEQGQVYRMAGSLSDTTYRKQAELTLYEAKDKAEEASRVKSQFLANMSHELRTPLNAVIGITEMLREDAEEQGSSDLLEPLERVSRAGKHLLNLINDILDISKIEAGRLELMLEHADLAGLIQDAAKTAQSLTLQNRNELRLQLARDLGVAYIDPVRVRQILLNLISNATKFTRDGVITVSAHRLTDADPDRIEISVADTGIGIAPEFLENLFQEFTQADTSATRKYGGTGLGLAISRRLCQMMQGEILVDSTLGEGTTFTVRLPTRVEVGKDVSTASAMNE